MLLISGREIFRAVPPEFITFNIGFGASMVVSHVTGPAPEKYIAMI